MVQLNTLIAWVCKENKTDEHFKAVNCLYKRRLFEINLLTKWAEAISNVTRDMECGSSAVRRDTYLKTVYEFHDSFIFGCLATATMIDDTSVFYWASSQHLLIKMYCSVSIFSSYWSLFRQDDWVFVIYLSTSEDQKTPINHHLYVSVRYRLTTPSFWWLWLTLLAL
jgi:hypothetical protein